MILDYSDLLGEQIAFTHGPNNTQLDDLLTCTLIQIAAARLQ